jgi:hypothetical protein
MKNCHIPRVVGYLLANDRIEYVSLVRVSPHSTLIGWVPLPQLSRIFATPEEAAVLAISIARFDLRVCVLLETESQWLVEEVNHVQA